jgi:hypothetical protein
MTTVWKVVGGVLVVAVPAAFNYLSAREDSDEAKVRAEVAYATTVEVVEELQATVHALELSQARLEGQVLELRRSQAARVGASPPVVPDTAYPAPAMKAPPRFEDAVRDFKAKK